MPWRWLVTALAMVTVTWGSLVALARRLPDGALKDIAMLVPACVTAGRRLCRDPAVPARVKLALAFALAWTLSPIDLIPEFIPVIGPLDDVVVIALALRYAARHTPIEALERAWPAEPRLLERLLRARRHVAE